MLHLCTCTNAFTILPTYFNAMTTKSPKSEHVACDLCVCGAKAITTNSSPCVVVVDLKTSSVTRSAMTSKSHRHLTHITLHCSDDNLQQHLLVCYSLSLTSKSDTNGKYYFQKQNVFVRCRITTLYATMQVVIAIIE